LTTKIEWTDETWNPVTGCTKVSTECKHCYAERLWPKVEGARVKREGGAPRPFTYVSVVPDRLDAPLHWKTPRRVFVNSMSDLFHEHVPVNFIFEVLRRVQFCGQHTFQVLTKRPAPMLEAMSQFYRLNKCEVLPNLWLGVSVGNQAAADERIPLLLQTPAAVRWISAEPLLGPVNVFDFLTVRGGRASHRADSGLDWVVAGGESGPNARPMHPDWARSLRDQCASAAVPFFFKQWGNWAPITYVDRESHHKVLKLTVDKRETVIGGPAEGTAPENMRNVGKKAAGRRLDGRMHDEYPS
jgi:protein gp37